jgi:hypothetical protein
MKYLVEYSKYEPKLEDIDQFKKLIKEKFPIKKDKGGDKYIIWDEKPNWLTNNQKDKQINKTLLRKRIFNSLDKEGIHKPSLNKAIKDWFDENSK